MARGLDHMVHAVRNLDAAADLYRRLGFTVGARNRHPWGTQNHIVQFPGFFIELLGVAEPEQAAGDGLAELFGAFNRRFISRREGLSFLMLESRDAVADAAEFRAFPAHWDPKLRIPRGQVVAAASIVSPKY